MAIDTRYDFFLNVIDTAMQTLLTDDPNMLITNDDYLYMSKGNAIKLGYILGKCKHNIQFTDAWSGNYNEKDSEQAFNIYISEEIQGSTTATATLHKRVGYWQQKITKLLLNLGQKQTYSGGDVASTYRVTIKNTVVTDDVNFIDTGNKKKSPSLGIMFSAEFRYDQANL